MNSKLKAGLIIGAAVLAAIVVYEYVSPSGAANQDSGDGTPTVSTSIKLGVATATAAGAAWVIIALLPVGL